jgi:primosomal protein N' (replication factor Y)
LNYKVVVPFNVPSEFTYFCEDVLQIGQLVVVNFRNNETVGVISGINADYCGRIKTIMNILPYAIKGAYIEFARFVSGYVISNIGNVIRLLVPFSSDSILFQEKDLTGAGTGQQELVTLSHAQSDALQRLQVDRVNLLHGITGSGKTEVFLRYVYNMSQVLIMVPEISLSSELAQKVSSRLNIPVFIWHHSISPIKKRDIWKKAVNGGKMVVVGARSALFIPFSNLQCIIIDEEHDTSFKQSERFVYNARDMGIYLSHLLKIPIILSSATPSIETFYNATSGKYNYIRIESKYFNVYKSPQFFVEDLKKQKRGTILCFKSISLISECLKKNKQALVFVNRRGYIPKILCASCGQKLKCPHCDAWLCHHLIGSRLLCHYCGYKMKVPTTCCQCGEVAFVGIGFGVEKVYEELERIFPSARIMSLSSDNMNTQNKISKIIKTIQKNEVDIIVGTQVMSKGHNFMNLNTIIISCIDSLLYGEDFRSIERAFQTMHQITGRAGRSATSDGANIVFQTYAPDDPFLKLLSVPDTKTFYEIEINNRKRMKMPPFGRIANINLSSLNKNSLQGYAKDLSLHAPSPDVLEILGPIVPTLSKLRNSHRLRFTVRSRKLVQERVRCWINSAAKPNDVNVAIDVDPQDFA